MTNRRIEMERFSLISSKPFQSLLAALKAAVGHPHMAEFAKAAKGARTFAELDDARDLDTKIERLLRESGRFMKRKRRRGLTEYILTIDIELQYH